MPAPWLAIAQGAVKLGEGLYGDYSARRANKWSKQFQQRAHDFAERMSSTAWQRGVQDMRAAGINPLMAATQGGASSPSGTGGSGNQATTPSSPDIYGMKVAAATAKLINQQAKTEEQRTTLTQKQHQAITPVAIGGSTLGGAADMISDIGSGFQTKLFDTALNPRWRDQTAKRFKREAKQVIDFASGTGRKIRKMDAQMKKQENFLDWMDLPENWSRRQRIDWFNRQSKSTQDDLRQRFLNR